jgi:hypothetical protein
MNSADEMAATTEPTKRQSATVADSDDAQPMNSADKMAATIEPTKWQSATVAGSDDALRDFDEFHAFRATLEDFQPTSHQHKPVADLRNFVSGIDHHLDHDETSERKAIYDSVLSIANAMKRRGSQGFARYLVAVCIGVAATLAWQSYGWVAKHAAPTAPPAPTIDPQVHQIALNVAAVQQSVEQQLAAVRQIDLKQVHQIALDVAAVRQSVEQQLAAVRQIDPQQVHQVALDVAAVRQSVEQQLAAVRQTVEQLSAGQEQMTRRIDTLQTSEREILEKIPASSPPRPVAAPARKPTPTAPPSSRAPPPPYLRPYP